MLEERYYFKSVYLKGEVYVFSGCYTRRCLNLVEKFSCITNKWVKLSDIPYRRQYFCTCAFIDKVYIIGGHGFGYGSLNSCLQFDIKKFKWKEVAKINELREEAACNI